MTSTARGRITVTPYDSLIVATGSGQSYFGNDRFAEHAPGLKSIDDALRLRARIFGAFEMAELEPDPDLRAQWLTFVVVGGVPTGVEMAGRLAELSRRSLSGNFRRIDPAQARVVLVEAGDALLANFGTRLSRRALRGLTRLGVDVRLGTRVVDVDAEGVEVDDGSGRRRIVARTKVWAAGVAVSPLGASVAHVTGAELNRAGQVAVGPDLTLPGHPEVFVVGDLMQLPGVAGVAQIAIQGGRYAARRITDRLAGRPDGRPSRYFDKGNLATISRFQAVAAVGPLRLSGSPAWVLWLGVHLFYLVGFKNRVTVVLHWAVTFVGRGRSERTITLRQAELPDLPTGTDPGGNGRVVPATELGSATR